MPGKRIGRQTHNRKRLHFMGEKGNGCGIGFPLLGFLFLLLKCIRFLLDKDSWKRLVSRARYLEFVSG